MIQLVNKTALTIFHELLKENRVPSGPSEDAPHRIVNRLLDRTEPLDDCEFEMLDYYLIRSYPGAPEIRNLFIKHVARNKWVRQYINEHNL